MTDLQLSLAERKGHTAGLMTASWSVWGCGLWLVRRDVMILFSINYFIVVQLHLPAFSPHYPLPSGYCQIVLNFSVSICILLACLFC